MDLGDVSTRKLNHGRVPPVNGKRFYQHRDSGRLRFSECAVQIRDLIACHLAAVWKRKVSIRDENGHQTECGFDSNSSNGIAGPPNLDAESAGGIRNCLTMGESQKHAQQVSNAIL